MDQEDRERLITLDHLTLIRLPDLLVDSFVALRWEARGTPDILAVEVPSSLKISTIVTLGKWFGAADPGGMESDDLATACASTKRV